MSLQLIMVLLHAMFHPYFSISSLGIWFSFMDLRFKAMLNNPLSSDGESFLFFNSLTYLYDSFSPISSVIQMCPPPQHDRLLGFSTPDLKIFEDEWH